METKMLSFAIETKGASDGPGEFEAILSTEDLDRDGEIVLAKAFDPLPQRIAIDVDHGLKVSHTVGSGFPYYDGDVLKIKGTFASTTLGQEVRTLVSEGHIGHMSVAMAFVTKQKRSDGITYITKGTLINAGFTGIPANTSAAVLSAKSFIDALDEKVGARNSTSDAQRIQGAHDLFVELGAACSADKCAHVEAETKSIAEDPDGQAAAPAAATPPALTHMAAAALASAELLLLDT